MTPAQQKSVSFIAADELKALAKFDQDHAKQAEDISKKLGEAQKKLDDLNKLTTDANASRQAYQKQIEALHKQSDLIAASKATLSHTFKARAMGLLTTPQRATWVAYKLNRMMMDEFMPIGLTAEQQTRVKDTCVQSGLAATKADVSADQELVDAVKQQIRSGICDAEQRMKYADVLKERQAKAAGT